MKNLSLRWRIMLTYVAIILIGMGGLSFFAGQQIESAAQDDFEQTVISQANLVARGLESSVEHFFEGEEALQTVQTQLDSFAAQLESEIILFDAEGNVWLQNTGAAAITGALPATELSTVSAGETIIRSDTGFAYAISSIRYEGQVLALIRLSVSNQEVQQNVQRRWLVLIAGGIGLTLLTIVVSVGLATSLTRPLLNLRNAAMKLSEGDLSSRVPGGRNDEIGLVAASFNHMAEEVQSMLDEQRAFASNAAHELRTPLTTIQLRTEILTENMVEPETQQQYIMEIDQEIKRLTKLVNDVMLLSRVDTGRVVPGEEQIDLLRLARKLQADSADRLADKNLIMRIQCDLDFVAVRGSQSHMLIVFQNILDNAIKYSQPDGHITWVITQHPGMIESRIKDTGIGLTPEDRENIFKLFYRADQAHTRDIQGNGLGLALVKKVLDIYGGSIHVESSGLETGTIFIVNWPH